MLCQNTTEVIDGESWMRGNGTCLNGVTVFEVDFNTTHGVSLSTSLGMCKMSDTVTACEVFSSLNGTVEKLRAVKNRVNDTKPIQCSNGNPRYQCYS